MPNRILSLFRNLFRKRAVEEALDDELRSSVEVLTQEKMKRGLSPSEARREALIELGGIEQVKEEVRAVRTGRFLEDFARDLRFAYRTLAKSPGFTAVTVLTLALGIGTNTAIFSVVNGVLLRPLPYPDPGRLVTVYETGRDLTRGSVSYPNFLDWRREGRSFTDMAAYRSNDVILTGSGEPEHLLGEHVSAGFFSALGTSPYLGRTFSPQEDQKGAEEVVILTYGLWKRSFGADPHILGKTLTLSGKGSTVVGVLRADFRFRDPAELYIPLGQWNEPGLYDREVHPGLHGIARLGPGVTLAEGQAEMSAIARHLSEQYPKSNAGRGVALVPMKDDIVGNIRPTLLILLGAVAFVLIIACANVANLLLARSTARAREFAVRAALGAGRRRVVQQLITESLLLALGGGGMGVLLAFWGTRLALAAAPNTLPHSDSIGLDPYVLLFTIAISTLAGILFGLTPAFRSSNVNLQEALKEGTRGSGGSRHRAERVFVIVEVSLAVVLLAGAGLMIQSIWRLWRVDTGFNTHNLLTAQVALSPGVRGDPSATRVASQQMLARVATVPGVRSLALTNLIPLTDDWNEIPFWIGTAAQPPADQMRSALFYIASPDYLRVMGIPLITGRFFTERDTTTTPTVVVIDDVMAKHIFSGEDPIGKQINLPFLGRVQIVGVVGHVKQRLDANETVNELYFPFFQIPDKLMAGSPTGIDLLLRTGPVPFSLLAPVRAQVAGPTLDQPLYGVRTIEQIMSVSMARRRFTMLLLIIFAAAALVLAAVGIYGVMSYAVSLRTHEIGVRMALGASRDTVLGMVLREGMTLAVTGTIVGLLAAMGLTRFMASLLFGVHPTDPWTMVAVATLLGAIALFASFVPAWRAARVDPIVALRNE